jgi:hypothetical protein
MGKATLCPWIGISPMTLSRCATTRWSPACSELILTTPDAASDPQQADQQVVSYLRAHPGIAPRLLAQPLAACHDLSAGR